ncbi:MAG: efflux RND transporter periplasmic adaptor subunit [Pirellulales bacterium]
MTSDPETILPAVKHGHGSQVGWRILSVVTSLICCSCQQPIESLQTSPPAPVKVMTVRLGPIAATIHSIGSVVPVDESVVASSLPGVVIEMPVRDGQYVERGELLAQLREKTLSIRLQEARALLHQREQELEQFKNGYRQEEIQQAEARLKSAEAESKYAARRAARAEKLQEQTAISEEQSDEAIYQAQRSLQAVAEAEADHQLKQNGYRREQVEAARAARDAQQQNVLRGEDEVARLSVVAPFAGFVTQRHTDLGQWVDEGGPVVTLIRLDEVEVRVQVEENAIGQISVGQNVEVHVDALGKGPMEGVINSIVPRTKWQQGSRSFPVIVRMPNTIESGQPMLKEGMLARIAFYGATREVLLINKDAIDRSSGKPMVYIVQSDNRVRAVEVQDGLSQGQFIEVCGDLQAGDRIVTEGVERLRPYQEVIVVNRKQEQVKGEEGPASIATDSSSPNAGG